MTYIKDDLHRPLSHGSVGQIPRDLSLFLEDWVTMWTDLAADDLFECHVCSCSAHGSTGKPLGQKEGGADRSSLTCMISAAQPYCKTVHT